MFGDSLCTIRIQGALLTPAMGDELFSLACEMCGTYQKRRKIKADDFEGWMTTGFKQASLDTITGIEFKARIESEAGDTRCWFILSVTALRELAEMGNEGSLIHLLCSGSGEIMALAPSSLSPQELVGRHRRN